MKMIQAAVAFVILILVLILSVEATECCQKSIEKNRGKAMVRATVPVPANVKDAHNRLFGCDCKDCAVRLAALEAKSVDYDLRLQKLEKRVAGLEKWAKELTEWFNTNSKEGK